MTNELPTISNEIFHNWKSHQCTKALISLLDDCLETIDKRALQEISGLNKINTDLLNFCRGSKNIIEQVKERMLNKDNLELFLVEEEDEEVSN